MRSSTAKVARRQKGVVAEVLLGLLIVAVLAATIAPRVLTHGGSAIINPTKADIATFCGALENFKADCGRFPTSSEGLSALKVAPTALLDNWKGPYLEGPLGVDRWGRAYMYEQHGSGKHEVCIVKSYGADGKPGGTEDDADTSFPVGDTEYLPSPGVGQ